MRVGDKHTENAPKELPRYLRQLRLLPATEPPITTVFLATDEPRVVEQACRVHLCQACYCAKPTGTVGPPMGPVMPRFLK